jgi:hypothetical protein
MCLSLYGQEDLNVRFTGYSFVPETQSEATKSQTLTSLNAHTSIQTALVILHRVPAQEEIKILELHGLKLIEYIPHMAWTAEIYKPSATLAQFPIIKALYSLAGRHRLSPELQSGNIPSHALREDRVWVDVNTFSGYDAQTIEAEFQNQNWEVIKRDISGDWWVLKIPVAEVSIPGTLPFVSYAAPIPPEGEPENYNARSGHRTANLQGNGLAYDGRGISVMLQDDGPIGPHIDFAGRIGASYPTTNRGDHGDHVAGTIMGAGNRDPKARGMAPAATVYVYGAAFEAYPGFDSIYSHYSKHGIRITSTSYSDGCNAGYSALSRKLDLQTAQFADLLHIFSAGNSGTSSCGFGAVGFGNITGGHKVAKNAITVANLDAYDQLSASSSRGPAKDGRLKPDISAVGTDVYSTTDPDNYTLKSGTSMSCPGVSGTAAVLSHAFVDMVGYRPAAGLLRNILLNAADDLGNPGPDFLHGFGRMNARQSLEIIQNTRFDSASVSNGDTSIFYIHVPAGLQQVRIMLTWDDPAAAVSAQRSLVNDLDLSVTDAAQRLQLPLVLDHTPSGVQMPAIQARDQLNNVEQIVLENPTPGNHEVLVSGYLIPSGPQKFYITYLFDQIAPRVAYPNGGEGFVPGEKEILRWDSPVRNTQTSLEYSTDSGQSWIPITTVPAGRTYYEWTVPNVATGKALIKATQGVDSDISDQTFSILRVPAGLMVAKACVDSMELNWNQVSGANRYTIYKLGNEYMDSIGTSSTNKFVFKNGYHPYTSYWFAVSAHNTTTGANSRRSAAIQKNAGISNCTIDIDAALIRFDNDVEAQLTCQSGSNMLIGVYLANQGVQTLNGFTFSSALKSGPVSSQSINAALSSGKDTVIYLNPVPALPLSSDTLLVWVALSGDMNRFNDTLKSPVRPIITPLIDTPFVQTFDAMTRCGVETDCGNTVCPLADGWHNASNGLSDDIDWRVHYGGTATTNTGPLGDHTSVQGQFIYLEASNCFEKKAILVSPCIDLSQASKSSLTFWYHMFGADMGALHTDIFVDGRWIEDAGPVLSGIDVNTWQQQIIDLAAFNGKQINVRFRGITGPSFRSDMALDDIAINYEKTDEKLSDSEQSISGFLVYPNPATQWIVIKSVHRQPAIQMIIRDAQGRAVISLNPNNTEVNIDISGFSKGIYIVEIQTENGAEYYKLLKQ